MVLSGMTAIISGTIIATPNLKNQKIALETLFRYGAVRFHLRSTAKRQRSRKVKKRHFLAKQFFDDNVCV